MKMSTDFTLHEMTKSDTAIRLGLDNKPNYEQTENLKELCINVLQPARDHFGRINVNSGFRSPELCRAIGSNEHSNHAFGLAADIEADSQNVYNFDLLLWIYENCEFKELIAEYFDKNNPRSGWVHVAYQKDNNKRQLKLKDKTHNYEHVDIDYLKKLYNR